jgi:type IV secretory pathway VirB3-like protein
MATISSLEIPVSCKILLKHKNRFFSVAITKISMLGNSRYTLFYGDRNPDHPLKMITLWGDI